HLLRARTNLRDTHRRRYLEQNVTGMHQIAALKFPRMCVVIAPAFLIRRMRRHDLAPEQLLDRLIDSPFVASCRIENAARDCSLSEQLGSGAESAGASRTRGYINTIHRDAHDRIGSFARVCGVRTI